MAQDEAAGGKRVNRRATVSGAGTPWECFGAAFAEDVKPLWVVPVYARGTVPPLLSHSLVARVANLNYRSQDLLLPW